MSSPTKKRKVDSLKVQLENEIGDFNELSRHITDPTTNTVHVDESVNGIRRLIADLEEANSTFLTFVNNANTKVLDKREYRLEIQKNNAKIIALKESLENKLSSALYYQKKIGNSDLELDNSKKQRLINDTDEDYNSIERMQEMIITLQEFKALAEKMEDGDEKKRHIAIFQTKISEYLVYHFV